MLNTVTEIINHTIIINLFKDVQDVIKNILVLEGIAHPKKKKKVCHYLLMLFFAFSCYFVGQSGNPVQV